MATAICANDNLTPLMVRPGAPPILDARMPDVGTVLLGRWRIVAWAGVGSASVVFRGKHLDLDLPVAIKIVNRAEYPARAKAIDHLRNEAEVLKRLNHRNISRLWDFSNDPECPFLVTTFVEGMTLGEAIRHRGQLERRQVARAAQCIADALEHATQFGIVHRDIKPDNVILATDQTAKIIDFGLAAIAVESAIAPAPVVPVNTWIGTAAYLAPEQARSTCTVDHRADIYALGATMYHAITGRLPFDGGSVTQVILRRMREDPPPPIAHVPEIGERFSALVMRMMSRDPDKRYQTYPELQEALLDSMDDKMTR
jgi:serine/threonine protein kinase